MRAQIFAATCIALIGSAALAQERATLGTGRLFTNDFLGDGEDRWRTGSYSFSLVRGQDWTGARPGRLGELLEYRLRTEIIAPTRHRRRAIDRPYVGALSFGLHTHAALGGLDVSVGADVVAIGPQTGVSEFQDWYHTAFSLPDAPGVDHQLGDAFHAAGTVELAWPVRLSETVTLRPFAETQAGAEDLVRVGADVFVGAVGHADLLVRDVVTGQLYRAVEGGATGLGFVAGADWTQVRNSIYLPEESGTLLEEERIRARFGAHWQLAPQVSFFYGLTWLSEEFQGQNRGQTLGSLKLNFNY